MAQIPANENLLLLVQMHKQTVIQTLRLKLCTESHVREDNDALLHWCEPTANIHLLLFVSQY